MGGSGAEMPGTPGGRSVLNKRQGDERPHQLPRSTTSPERLIERKMTYRRRRGQA